MQYKIIKHIFVLFYWQIILFLSGNLIFGLLKIILKSHKMQDQYDYIQDN